MLSILHIKGEVVILLILVLIALIILIGFVKSYIKNPFTYPSITIYFDISKKRQPVYDDYIDEWINSFERPYKNIKDEFRRALKQWDDTCIDYLKHCYIWKTHRKSIYKNMRNTIKQNDYEMFQFVYVRNQTRYKQQNYQKYSYIVQNTDNIFTYTVKDLLDIADELEEIDYETTRAKWESKNQRILMTKELKLRIKERDNYTCQICGKYMPDDVGLHVDHIIPIKKGGKSVESNLQVLCDKCNLRKGANIDNM